MRPVSVLPQAIPPVMPKVIDEFINLDEQTGIRRQGTHSVKTGSREKCRNVGE
jgi:hypothetical protein